MDKMDHKHHKLSITASNLEMQKIRGRTEPASPQDLKSLVEQDPSRHRTDSGDTKKLRADQKSKLHELVQKRKRFAGKHLDVYMFYVW